MGSLGLSSEGEEIINQSHESDDADDDMDEDSDDDEQDSEQDDDDDFHGIEQSELPEFDAKSEASDGSGIAMDIDEYEPDRERRDHERRERQGSAASEESESMFIPNDTPSRASSEAIIDLTEDEPGLADDNQGKRSQSLSPGGEGDDEGGGDKRAQTYSPLMDVDEEMVVVGVERFVSEPWF